MKNLFVLLFFALSQFLTAQEVIEVKDTKISIQTVKVECESAKELATINWNDIKDIIEKNEPEQKVSLEFGVHQKIETNEKVKGSFNFKITGKSKDVLKIVERAQNGVKALKNISTKK